MRPYGLKTDGYPDTHPKIECSRAVEKREAEQEIEEQLESDLDSAEIRLIECDAGYCKLCGGPCQGL